MSTENNVYEKVVMAIDKVRPYLITDGGNVELVEVTEDLTVKVKLLGACSGCPFSEQTLRAGIEEAIKKEVPNLKELIAIE